MTGIKKQDVAKAWEYLYLHTNRSGKLVRQPVNFLLLHMGGETAPLTFQ